MIISYEFYETRKSSFHKSYNMITRVRSSIYDTMRKRHPNTNMDVDNKIIHKVIGDLACTIDKQLTGWVVTWFLLGYIVRKNGGLLSTPMF